MVFDPSRRHNGYDVALHCTPNGVRCPFTSMRYKHRTPSGVLSFFYECRMIHRLRSRRLATEGPCWSFGVALGGCR